MCPKLPLQGHDKSEGRAKMLIVKGPEIYPGTPRSSEWSFDTGHLCFFRDVSVVYKPGGDIY